MKHFSHECALNSPEIVTYGVCNICYKDEPVELACKPCQFDLCKACSKLPQKVSHDFHPDHPLELCLRQFDRKPLHVICSGCGNMFTGSLYECKECEIYLDLGCALLKNIFTGWDAKEMLHYSHCHLLRRSRPGLKVNNLCLLCELPVSPSVICYGCVYCCLFVHERCLDLPREIQHPVHSAHPLRRLDYTHNCALRTCDACGLRIYGPPLSCVECDFDLHLRCAC
uniref:Phorbol-ester/DAG-type domain-containing protein n=1 Tax=Noccaea caerulescens TaxID=107243 RepID=A0A1J3F167_NOCCA